MKRMNIALLLAALFLIPGIMNAESLPTKETRHEESNIDNLHFYGKTDHKDSVYKAGEEMVFSFYLKDEAGNLVKDKYVKWTRQGDDGKTEEGIVKTDNQNPVIVKSSINKPGFVRVTVKVCDENGKTQLRKNPKSRYVKDVRFNSSAGVDLDNIKEGVAEPKDFDEFWARQKMELAKVPLKILEKKNVGEEKGHLFYDIKVSCSGKRPVSGYLVIPKDAKPKSLPAVVSFRGYSVCGAQKPRARNMIALQINAHGIENGREKEYYDNLRKGELKSYGFSEKENKNPDTSYFKGMLTRVIRALEFVKSLPEWNGETLKVQGGSQGGLQALAAAGLDNDVTFCGARIPWCCDLGGVTIGRLSGWRPKYADGLPYFDAVNHAKRIKCETSIFAGLGDYVCPPSGVVVLYNNINAPKTLKFRQGQEHGYIPEEKTDITVFTNKKQ